MTHRERRYWFRKKRFGFGWSPATAEGWAAIVAVVAIDAGGSRAIAKRATSAPSAMPLFHVACVLAFVATVIATGEPLHGR